MAEVVTSAGQSLPYVMAYGNIKRTLEEVIKASVPEKFTQDFLVTKLGVKGGSGKMVLPFLKKIGFLNSDGTPTDMYQDFRIEPTRALAANEAILKGYGVLHEMNEYFYDLSDKELKDLIVRATGASSESSTVNSILGSIKMLKDYANFEMKPSDVKKSKVVEPEHQQSIEAKKEPPLPVQEQHVHKEVRLGYTININLPASSDIAVYNAIFKSLKDNILDE